MVARLRGSELRFATRPGVFSKKGLDSGSALLINCVEVLEGTLIADLGCGTGVIGMACSKLDGRGRVHLLDDHLRAVELARQNVALNHLANTEVYLSDLFSAVDEIRYDQIVTNLPAQLGNEFLEEAVSASFEHLRQGGTLWIVVVSNLRAVIERCLAASFVDFGVVARGAQHVVLRARKSSEHAGSRRQGESAAVQHG